ncbi:hypothetical protein BCR44DRAFT_47532 [Catenaria anguillulae PL171]|uniref:Sulfide:quinone oxidoreductase, mitochondrial n=1 Tax=Catenaria anguillulae PL171 TaxID=765915 RepID=A0A1Y2HV33_9FUNG|nr:hypothetical protein BCR44DRAFT_47532 [Catenaria anguillulae PL171]
MFARRAASRASGLLLRSPTPSTAAGTSTHRCGLAQGHRSLATAAATVSASDKYRIVIVGAGTGGLAAAHGLAENLHGERIAIVDPSAEHYNQPLWTFVGGGLKPHSASVAPTSSLLPRAASWIRSSVTRVDPTAKLVHTSNGRALAYDYLVLAPGIESQWDKIKGLSEALADPHAPVVSNYHKEYVKKTAPTFKALKKGNAVFTMPSTPIKCAGAPQKIMYIAEEYWRESSPAVRSQISVNFYSGIGKIFAIDKYAAALTQICADRNLKSHFLHDLVAIDSSAGTATFRKLALAPGAPAPTPTGDHLTVPFDFLHAVPPMGPPAWLAASGLASPTSNGFISVNQHTLQHSVYPTVFALGDATSAPTSKTAAAIAAQSPVLVRNLLAHMSGAATLDAQYDGYTSCPLVTGRKSLILAEFSGYSGKPMETFGGVVDQAQESWFMYQATAEAIPWVYWKGLVTGGWWKGPAGVRKAVESVVGKAE